MPRQTKPAQNDPFANREARRYADPIASRELILATLRNAKGPLKLDKLLTALDLHTPAQRTALSKRLNAMLRAGQLLIASPCGKVGMNLLTGSSSMR